MPKGTDWLYFIVVSLGFIIQIAYIKLSAAYDQIMDNWAENKYNPLFLIFSSDPKQDFELMIQNIQTSFMGYLLEPLNFITSNLSTMGFNFSDTLNDMRTEISNIRTFLSSIADSIMGVFMNLIIEFQKIIIKTKDILGKVIASMVVFLYVLDTVFKTGGSIWKGPPGQTFRSIGNMVSCFHPETLLKTADGKRVCIKDVEIDTVLEGGHTVFSLMKFKKRDHEPYYRFTGGVDNMPVFVTGEHVIYENESGRRRPVCVKHCKDAVQAPDMTSDFVYCLITDTGYIQIGSRLFHDWEDDEVRKKMD
jgi:hypothetical protein